MATVWIVSLEWNDPPSEVTGDTGIVGVYTRRSLAEAVAETERTRLDAEGQNVYDFSMVEDRYCGGCGELRQGRCTCTPADGSTVNNCTCCGHALIGGECDVNHDEWDIDVHVTEHEVVDAIVQTPVVAEGRI